MLLVKIKMEFVLGQIEENENSTTAVKSSYNIAATLFGKRKCTKMDQQGLGYA